MRLALLAVALVACTESDEGEGGAVADSQCESGLRWAGGNEESPLMHPGADCIGCHTDSREGPRFSAAGTVYALLDEATDCFGVSGVRVTITDASAQSVQVVTNQAGNFYTSTALVMPIQVRLEYEGRDRQMTFTPDVGACATCHTQTGASAAPGRILAP